MLYTDCQSGRTAACYRASGELCSNYLSVFAFDNLILRAWKNYRSNLKS